MEQEVSRFFMRSFVILLIVFCCSLSLFAQDIDPVFNPPLYSRADISHAVFDSEGYLYFAGSFDLVDNEPRFGISKLNTDGSLNEDFNIGTGFNGEVLKIISLSTDKLLIIGDFTELNGVATGPMVQLNQDGTIDESFAKATAITSASQSPIANIIELANGKLLAYGQFTEYNGFASNSMMILNQDGTVDESFSLQDENVLSVASVAPQENGKLVAALSRTNSQSGLITRLNGDGSKDETFNDFDTGNSPVYKIMAQSTDKLLVLADLSQTDGAVDLIRLNADGTSDGSFDLGTGIVGFFDDFQLNQNDEIFIGSARTQAGEEGTVDGNPVGLVSRLEADGAFDKRLASRLSNDASRVALGNSDQLAIYGKFLRAEDHETRGIALFENDEPDESFSADIKRVAEASVISRFDGFYMIANSDDTDFDDPGPVGLYDGVNSALIGNSWDMDLPVIRVMKPLFSGQAIYGGGSADGAQPIFTIAGWPPGSDDELDPIQYTFNDNWVNDVEEDDTGFFEGEGYGNDEVYIRGNLFVVGSFSGYNGATEGVAGIVKLDVDGLADADFTSPFSSDSVNITDVEILDNDKLMVVGVFTVEGAGNTELINGIARLNADGSLDETFDWSTHFSGGVIEKVEVVDDGYIIGGGFTAPRNGLAKINTDGSLNADFNADNSLVGNKVEQIQALDDILYVGGDFSEYQGEEISTLMKLSIDGTLDTDFKLPDDLTGSLRDFYADPARPQDIFMAGLFHESTRDRKLSVVRLGIGPEGAPTELTAAVSNDYKEVTLSWTPSIFIEGSYLIERAVNSQDNWEQIRAVGLNTTVVTLTLFEDGVTYYYRVRAGIGNFVSEYSNTVEVVVPLEPLAAPTDLTIHDIEYNEVWMGWQFQVDEEEGFVIERSENDQQNFVAIDSVDVNTLFFKDLAVEISTTYYYRVRAFKGNQESFEYSNVVEVEMPQTPEPAAPSNLTGSIVSASRIDLSWTDNSSNEDIFVLEKSVDNGQTWNIIDTPDKNETSFTDTQVVPGQPTAYHVFSMNRYGVSQTSNVFEVNGSSVVTSIEPFPSQDSRFDFSFDPVSYDLTFKLNNPSGKIRGYQLVSGAGAMKMREEDLEAQQISLNLARNAPGVYLLHVTSERDKYVVKLIKK